MKCTTTPRPTAVPIHHQKYGVRHSATLAPIAIAHFSSRNHTAWERGEKATLTSRFNVRCEDMGGFQIWAGPPLVDERRARRVQRATA
jgi:hypothetical protein